MPFLLYPPSGVKIHLRRKFQASTQVVKSITGAHKEVPLRKGVAAKCEECHPK